MAKKMKEVLDLLHQHYAKATPLRLVDTKSVDQELVDFVSQYQESISEFDEHDDQVIVGRDVEAESIVRQVIDASNQQLCSILPIVGMGGLGKTALAKLVFNHDMVKKHFDQKIWVCVSHPFVINKILGAILQNLAGNSKGLDTKQALVQELRKLMHNKTYFLVLDDVWNENAGLWRELKNCLINIGGKSKKSFILVTTRIVAVGKIMETLPSHHLSKLSDVICWSLFKKCANPNGLPMTSSMDGIQKELVKKIGGVPLVARVLGSALQFEGDDQRWLKTLKSVVQTQFRKKDLAFSILKLSVDRLPSSSLKQCFAYCSNFPKDYEFEKEKLVQMWMAQGFIEPPEGRSNLTMENVGDVYFNILLSRCLFQDVSKDDRGRIMSFKMHDLIHDIACAASSIKSIKLKHLRYLEISFSDRRELLKSIVLLFNLQTLKLKFQIEHLPQNFTQLVNLRHLQFEGILSIMPPYLSKITKLQTLPSFTVKLQKGCSISELGPLNYLKGSLKLVCLDNVVSEEEASKAKLVDKVNLDKLEFDWSIERKNQSYNDLEVLKGLQPHKNLQSLKLNGFAGTCLPNKIFVENLRKIELVFCKNCEALPMLGQLNNLKELYFYSLESIRTIGLEFYGNDANQRTIFAKLEKLSLSNMINLEQWKEVTVASNVTIFPHLKHLGIYNCPKLLNIPNIFGFCDDNDVKHLKCLMISHCNQLTELPIGIQNCCSITSLEITHNSNLIVNLQNMSNLLHLSVRLFPKLPEGLANLIKLKEMKIVGCIENYDLNFFMHLPSLTTLHLVDQLSSAMTQLPQRLQHASGLKNLILTNFGYIEALPEWLANFVCLESLSLSHCKNLKRLPSTQAMLCLTKLCKLYVRECPQLQLGEGDIERLKLSHLPGISVEFDAQYLIS